jgi:exosortase/archaeosortase family protein
MKKQKTNIYHRLKNNVKRLFSSITLSNKKEINFDNSPINITKNESLDIPKKNFFMNTYNKSMQSIHNRFVAVADYVSPINNHDEETKQTKFISISTVQMIVIFLCIIMIVMPFVTTFNEFITRIVMRIEAYRFIQNFIVPYEVRVVSGMLNAVGIEAQSSLTRINMIKGGSPIDVFISWNCIGWQSFILFLISTLVGLKGPYPIASKIEVVVVGILGTLLLNIFRISFIALIAYFFGELSAIIFHDYVSTIMVIIWLITYWAFAHQFLLHHLDFVKIKATNN